MEIHILRGALANVAEGKTNEIQGIAVIAGALFEIAQELHVLRQIVEKRLPPPPPPPEEDDI